MAYKYKLFKHDFCLFSYNIRPHSNTKSHCRMWALSDDAADKTLKTDKFIHHCPPDSNHGDENCHWCDLIPMMFGALEFCIQRAENNFGLDEDLREDLRFDLAKCKSHIYSYKFREEWWHGKTRN